MRKLFIHLQLVMLLLPFAACGRRPLTSDGIERNRIFAEILKREDRRALGDDGFFPARLHDRSQPEVQEWCAIALGRIGDSKALPWLYESFHDPAAAVRAAAAFAMGEIEDRELLRGQGLPSDPRAARELSALLDDPSTHVRMRAAEALGKIGQSADAQEIIGRVVSIPYDYSPERRAFVCSAITALMRLRNPAARPVLERLAGIDDPEIQWRVANAIYRMRAKEARPVVEHLLQSPNPDVQAYAARALGICGDPSLAGELTPFLMPIDPGTGGSRPLSVRVSALQALATLKASESVGAIKEALTAEDVGEANPRQLDQLNFAVQAAAALGNLSSKAAVPTLEKLVRFPGPIAETAVVALAKLSRDDPEALLNSMEEGAWFNSASGARAWAAALGELGGEPANNRLKAMLSSANGNSGTASLVVPSILQALARAQAPGLQDLLRNYFNADDGVILRAAVAAYKPDPGTPTPWRLILQAYSRISSSLDAETKVALIDRLGPWQDASEVQTFLRLTLKDPARNARLAAARLLRNAGAADVPVDLGPSFAPTSDFAYTQIAAARQDRTIAILDTERGRIEIELFREDAPLTAANFISLAQNGFFDGLSFMRVVPYFVIQGGDPRNDQEGGPGYTIRCEINMHPFDRGAVGMALSGKDTGGSQFFICLSPQPHLDGGYTCFGHVVSGMFAAEHMVAGDRILKVRIKDEVSWFDYRRY